MGPNYSEDLNQKIDKAIKAWREIREVSWVSRRKKWKQPKKGLEGLLRQQVLKDILSHIFLRLVEFFFADSG